MSPLSKDETVLICVHCVSGTCVHGHISPILGEHPCIVNIVLGPVTVHYREVSLYNNALLSSGIFYTPHVTQLIHERNSL